MLSYSRPSSPSSLGYFLLLGRHYHQRRRRPSSPCLPRHIPSSFLVGASWFVALQCASGLDLTRYCIAVVHHRLRYDTSHLWFYRTTITLLASLFYIAMRSFVLVAVFLLALAGPALAMFQAPQPVAQMPRPLNPLDAAIATMQNLRTTRRDALNAKIAMDNNNLDNAGHHTEMATGAANDAFHNAGIAAGTTTKSSDDAREAATIAQEANSRLALLHTAAAETHASSNNGNRAIAHLVAAQRFGITSEDQFMQAVEHTASSDLIQHNAQMRQTLRAGMADAHETLTVHARTHGMDKLSRFLRYVRQRTIASLFLTSYDKSL